MCPQPEMDRKKENMTTEILEKIIKDCQGKPLKKMNLFWMGDSTMDKKLIEKMRLIRKGLPNVKLYLSTNSELLTPEKSEIIINENLLDVINFDIDGFTKMTFEKVRKKLTFEKVVNNVKHFLNYKKLKSKNKPQTRITIIDMEPTKHEVEKFVSYWKPLADKVDVNHYNTWLDTQEDLNYDDQHQRSKHQNKLQQSKQNSFDFACTHPWDEVVIGADGRVGLCCLDYELKEEIGDIKKNTLQEIWQGKVMTDYRNKLLNLNYSSINSCKDCNAHTYQNDKLWAKLQK